MTKAFTFTQKQEIAQAIVASTATHCMLFGGGRSGKTFLHVRNVVFRALKAPGSRHCILRFRFNHVKTSIIRDTFPKVMRLAFPDVQWKLDKTDWFVRINPDTPQESEIWFGGLDDKERTEKILGNEYVTIYLNECSQISWSSVGIVLTRLAQRVTQVVQIGGEVREHGLMKPRFWYDCNPPNKLHWTYQLFVKKIDPETKEPLRRPENYASLQMNPKDNAENLSPEYLDSLDDMSPRLRKRFRDGEFADANPYSLFSDENFDKYREFSGELPEFVRVVVAVDPSGAVDGAEDAKLSAADKAAGHDNDAIGIVIAALGTDGIAYVLEDCTVNAGPTVWGRVTTDAYDRHQADIIVGEQNFGGGMVKYVIHSHRPRTPFKLVTASRGKHVRAEPFSVLYDQGKVRHVGQFSEMEEEMTGFSQFGYIGEKSPNRADALFWALAELFPAIVNQQKKTEVKLVKVANKWK